MKFFKKSSKRQINESILQHKYAIHFSSRNLFKGLTFTFLAWIVAAGSTVAFQNLVIKNSIFVTLFIVFLSAFTPLFIWSLFKGKSYFVCARPKQVTLRSILAVINFYTLFTSRAWISDRSSTLLFSFDTFFVPLLLYLMFKKKLSLLTWIGLVVSFLGLSVVFSFKLSIFLKQGIVETSVCLISAFFMGWLIVTTCYIIRHDPPLRQTMYTTFIGMLFSAMGILLTGWETPNLQDLVYMIIQGLAYSMMVLFYIGACTGIEPHVIAAISQTFPILTIFMNGFFEFYTLTFATYLGSLITIIGTVVVILATRFQIKEEDLILTE